MRIAEAFDLCLKLPPFDNDSIGIEIKGRIACERVTLP